MHTHLSNNIPPTSAYNVHVQVRDAQIEFLRDLLATKETHKINHIIVVVRSQPANVPCVLQWHLMCVMCIQQTFSSDWQSGMLAGYLNMD